MKKHPNKQRNTTPEIALRKWCVEQAVKLAPVPREMPSGFQYTTALIRKGVVIEQAEEIYEWVTALP